MRTNGDGMQVQMISFEIPVGAKQRLDACARRFACSTSDVLRTLIEQHLRGFAGNGLRKERPTTPAARGTIDRLDANGRGRITAEDGRSYAFSSTRRYLAPGSLPLLAEGRRVEFTPTDILHKGPSAIDVRVLQGVQR